jgi:predicted RNA-binding protein YlqC (UPF0109 family)
MNEANELVSYIVSHITGDPNCFRITTSIDERGVLLNIGVTKDQAGRLIGKEGATAHAIRSVLRALGTKNQAYYSLKIEVEDD